MVSDILEKLNLYIIRWLSLSKDSLQLELHEKGGARI